MAIKEMFLVSLVVFEAILFEMMFSVSLSGCHVMPQDFSRNIHFVRRENTILNIIMTQIYYIFHKYNGHI